MLNILVAGVGFIGRIHLVQYQKERRARVVAVVDENESLVKRVAEEFSIRTWGTDLDSVLDSEDIDAVTIATPPFTHRDLFIRAAKHRKHIHCEKPFALTLQDADAMVDACRKNRVKVMVSFVPRQTDAFVKMRQLVDSGAYGMPLYMNCKYFLNASPQTFMPPWWFWKKELGGGVLLENGGHIIDYARLVMGEVEEVTAVTDTLRYKRSWPPYFTDPNIEDIAIVVMRHSKGGLSTIQNGCTSSGRIENSVELVTEKGLLSLHNNTILIARRDGKVRFEKTYDRGLNIEGIAHEFVKYLLTDSSEVATEKDGRAVLEIALAAYESSKSGRAVRIPLRHPVHPPRSAAGRRRSRARR